MCHHTNMASCSSVPDLPDLSRSDDTLNQHQYGADSTYIKELKILNCQLKAIQIHQRSLLEAVHDPAYLATALYSKGLLDSLEWKNVTSSTGVCHTDRVCTMLDSVHKKISLNPEAYEKFLQVLKDEKSTSDIAQHIQATFERCLLREHHNKEHIHDHSDISAHADSVDSDHQLQLHFRYPPPKRICTVPSILSHITQEEDVTITRAVATSSTDHVRMTSTALAMTRAVESDECGLISDSDTAHEDIKVLTDMLQDDDSSDDSESEYEKVQIEKSLSLIQPHGSLKTKVHKQVYSKLFKMAWNGKDGAAIDFVQKLRQNKSVALDLKVVCMEVVHTVNTERDLKMLLSALAYTDRRECENKHLLKCRLHRRIAGMHYRNGDIEDAKDHLTTALQLAEQIRPDIDSVYTMRLEALILFEEYKKTDDNNARKGAEKYFQKAMDHARRQPEWKRLITERIKISKAHFHLDMLQHFEEQGKSKETIEQLTYRTRDTLEDVDESYLTAGDQAFFFNAFAKLMWHEAENLDGARVYAQKSLKLNRQCGFHDRSKAVEDLLTKIDAELDSTPQ